MADERRSIDAVAQTLTSEAAPMPVNVDNVDALRPDALSAFDRRAWLDLG